MANLRSLDHFDEDMARELANQSIRLKQLETEWRKLAKVGAPVNSTTIVSTISRAELAQLQNKLAVLTGEVMQIAHQQERILGYLDQIITGE